MKVGFNLFLWTAHVTEEHFSLFGELKRTGYDGVEIPVFEGDTEHFRKIGKTLADNGLAATAVTVMPEGADCTAADAATREGGRRHITWALDCCEAMGATLLGGPLHQTLGRFSGDGPTAEEKARCVAAHRSLADHAKKTGVLLSIEPLNRFECFFLNTIADSVAHVEAVGRPEIGILYDTFHANIEEKDPVGCIAPAIRSINHVHISANDRGTPGKDHVDWPATFAALKKAGYDDWLTIEAFGRALPALAAATRVWRDLFPAREEVYRFGHDFIREQWAKA
jgi:D-psicose/D-tagatose/L-ribulose 3-epimerase